jgi:deoxyribodipyrimidine photo-lyase
MDEEKGQQFSSKYSSWLANGSLSCRYAYHSAIEFELSNKGAQASTQKLIYELFWRDFNYYMCLHFGNKVFYAYGCFNKRFNNLDWLVEHETIKRWQEGRTGMPMVDAFMREMNCTGFMSNRGR